MSCHEATHLARGPKPKPHGKQMSCHEATHLARGPKPKPHGKQMSCHEATHLARRPYRKPQTAKRTKSENPRNSSRLFHIKALGVSNRKMSKTVKLMSYSDPPIAKESSTRPAAS
ncbi:hypothetical protein AVEN_42502-1 [Araneus ventricosus]|uniref:Uncharacterized protein n=1 Tax=Araneus ventricosus TaxID=182803 RepID=A0A4Y2DUQ4_ARAVE|nr:hypothetical protein AVEN_42502-1 [Araneus ventricosus]